MYLHYLCLYLYVVLGSLTIHMAVNNFFFKSSKEAKAGSNLIDHA